MSGRHPTVVSTRLAGPSSGSLRWTSRKSLASGCMSQVCPRIGAPPAASAETMKEVQPSGSSGRAPGAATSVAVDPSGFRRSSQSRRSVRLLQARSSAGPTPDAPAIPSNSAHTEASWLLCAASMAPAVTSTSSRSILRPRAYRATNSRACSMRRSVKSRISSRHCSPCASPIARAVPMSSMYLTRCMCRPYHPPARCTTTRVMLTAVAEVASAAVTQATARHQARHMVLNTTGRAAQMRRPLSSSHCSIVPRNADT